MLEVKNLHATIAGKEILKGVNLTVRDGEIHAIMGPNGSGKSTLSAVLTGNPLYTVTEGTAFFNGKNLLEMKPEDRAREGLFLSFQYPVEIPGVSMTNFMKAAINAKRAYEGKEPLKAADFMKLMRAYNGRENLESRAFRVLQQRVHHLLRGLRADQLAAFGAMRYACAGEQQSQIVINLGDRAHGRTRIAVCGLLVDRHRRAQSLDEIHIRLVHLPEELTRIRGQRLHIPALPLREQRIERE